jgi:hypothetical protein
VVVEFPETKNRLVEEVVVPFALELRLELVLEMATGFALLASGR